MSHLTKLERIQRKRRKKSYNEDYKGHRSPQPYKRTENEEILDEELSHAEAVNQER